MGRRYDEITAKQVSVPYPVVPDYAGLARIQIDS